jgi:predicted glycosyltransferase
VVVRTPPEVSLYHRFENDLFAQVLDTLRIAAAERGVQPVVLPRVASQRAELVRVPGFVVPERAIDAQSLIASADLVISAGGTMNREAVALGVPVCTTFEGRPGAVDERLIEEGRMRRLAAAEDLDLAKRERGHADARVRRDPHALVELLRKPLQERARSA